jgi:hypothetical protein
VKKAALAITGGDGLRIESIEPFFRQRVRRTTHRFCLRSHQGRAHRHPRRRGHFLRQNSSQHRSLPRNSGANHHSVCFRMASASSSPLQPTLTSSPLPTEHYAFPIALAQLFNSIVSSAPIFYFGSATSTARAIANSSSIRSRPLPTTRSAPTPRFRPPSLRRISRHVSLAAH